MPPLYNEPDPRRRRHLPKAVQKARRRAFLNQGPPPPYEPPRKKTVSEAMDELIATWSQKLEEEDRSAAAVFFFIHRLDSYPADEAFARLALGHESMFVQVGVLEGVMSGELELD